MLLAVDAWDNSAAAQGNNDEVGNWWAKDINFDIIRDKFFNMVDKFLAPLGETIDVKMEIIRSSTMVNATQELVPPAFVALTCQ